MKTLDEILKYKSGPNCNMVDGRDISRLAKFIPEDALGAIGLELCEGGSHTEEELTEANVLVELQDDLGFAIEKAEGQRGISASLMWDGIAMWLWGLDDDRMDGEPCHGYGLNMLLTVRQKYAGKFPEAEAWKH